MQKGICFKLKAPVRPALVQANCQYLLDRAEGLALRGAEGTEIVLTQQQVGGLPHGGVVQRPEAPAYAPGFHAGAYGRLQQHIGIAPRTGRGPAMKVGAGADRPLHGNVTRQMGIGAAHPGVGRALAVGVKVNHLHQRMNPGIGAAGAQGGYRLRGEAGQGRFQLVLHGLATRLALPTLVVLAVIGKPQRHSHKHLQSRSVAWTHWLRPACPTNAGRVCAECPGLR